MLTFIPLFGAFIAGLFVSCVFFYTLWLTTLKIVNAIDSVSWFTAWFVGSWLCRMVFVTTVFYWVAKDNWHLLIPCFLGFLIGRWLICQTSLTKQAVTKVGAKHAP